MRAAGSSVGVGGTTAVSAGSATPSCSERQKLAWSSRSAGAGIGQYVGLGGASALGLGEEVLEGGNPLVPLDERRDAAEARDGGAIEVPDGVADRVVVRVEEMRAVIGVSGEMELSDPTGGDAGEIRAG